MVVARTSGRPAALRATPVYAALAIIAAVLFGQNGIYPRDVVTAAEQFPGVRVALWIAWIIALTPAARALLDAERLAYLRWLPVANPVIWTTWTALLLAIELPWLLLWWAGGGTATGLAAGLVASAGHACLARPARSARDRAVTAAALVGLLALISATSAGQHPVWWLAAAAACWVLAIPKTWAHGLEHVVLGIGTRLPARPVLALTAVYTRGLLRTRSSVLLRALALVGLGAGFATLVHRANELGADGLASFSAGITAVVFPLALSGLITPIVDTERALGWLLDSTATPRDTRIAARILATTGLAAGQGMIYSALVTWWAALPAALAGRIALGAVAMAVAMALFALRAARWAQRGTGAQGRTSRSGRESNSLDDHGGELDGNRIVVAMVAAILAALIAIGWFGDLAIAALATVALAMVWDKAP